MSANPHIHSLAKDELDFVENWLDDTSHQQTSKYKIA